MNPEKIIPLAGKLFFLLSIPLCMAASSNNLYEDDSTLISKALYLDITRAGDRFVAVGERGHIVLSDNGEQWQKVSTGTEATLTAVYFHDNQHGWAVGHDAVILRTSNGGQEWEMVYSAPEEEAPLLDIWFSDNKEGIAIGAYGFYLTTQDGGRSWQRSELNVLPTGEPGEDSENDLTELYDLHLNGITSLANDDLVIAAEAGRIYHSTNGGQDWIELPSPYVGSFFGVLPLQDSAFIIFGLRGHLYRTDDLGENWHQPQTHTRESLNNAVRLQDGRVVVAGMGGTLLVSDDEGMSFRLMDMAGRNSYAGLATRNDRLLLAGDHGIRAFSITELEPAHE